MLNGPRSGGTRAKYGIDVSNDENLAFAGAVKDRYQVVGQSGRLGWFTAHLGAQLGQPGAQDRVDLGAARNIAGS